MSTTITITQPDTSDLAMPPALNNQRLGLIIADKESQATALQVIGRVGKSGLATGPHVHYSLWLKGRSVDPFEVRFPAGRPVSVDAHVRFGEIRDMRLAELREASPPLVLEAAL